MKANIFGAVILCAISLTQGSEYNYSYDNNEICIDVKMDVLFTLSNGKEVVKFDGNNFTVKSGDCATTGEYQAVLTLTNSNEDLLALTFNVNTDLSVNMSSMFTFAPFEFFPGTPIATTTNLLDTGDLILGNYTQLYQCLSPQRMTLNGVLEGTTYTLFMDMSSVQIQAFNIENGTISTDVFACSADQMTTVAQETTKATSEPTKQTTETSASTVTTVVPSTETTVLPSNETTEKTTVGPSNVTTEGPTTEPITVPPTTAPAPAFPPRSTYEVMEKSKACLVMAGRFQLEVTYTTQKNKTVKTIVNVPVSSNVTVTGKCASGNDTESSLKITPKDDADIDSLTFNFKIMDGKASIESWMAELKELNHTVNETVMLTSPKLYYKCEKGGNFSDDILALKYKELQVQAFNVENGNFSETGFDCPADAPDEPAPGKPPVVTYTATGGNKTCVVFKGSIQFHIPYVSTKGNTTAVISVPVKTNTTGDCNMTMNGLYTQMLSISFYETWKLNLYFSSNKKQTTDLLTADAGVANYDISQIELTYDYNNNLFSDVDDSVVGKTEMVTTNQTFLSTSASKSYMCSKDTTFTLNQNGLSMVTKDLQFQAFRTTNTTDFDAATECAGDEDTNSIVPIAVGAALAGLVIIVLIAYLIGRKRSRSGYEQV
ncbi:lysosome-associated membrane glycoprotein 2-like [Saccostrea cucullata]|uniref:lysosome-associated membrane glycoprotein 2-like n=1 Tax=Saccostrea cuccullata TaxID=36930 RepID=UPI002ECFFC9B